jgi:hypothetical protein
MTAKEAREISHKATPGLVGEVIKEIEDCIDNNARKGAYVAHSSSDVLINPVILQQVQDHFIDLGYRTTVTMHVRGKDMITLLVEWMYE